MTAAASPSDPAIAAADAFLAACVRAHRASEPLPGWPDDRASPDPQTTGERALFHGIALLLVESPGGVGSWPAAAAEPLRDEARLQVFWEASHRRAVSTLIEAMHQAGLETQVMKGTALAYAIHANPAVRRRGDTDLVVIGQSRRAARAVLKDCGFESDGRSSGLQEGWLIAANDGFIHEVDVHWRMSSSAAIADALERIGPHKRARRLPRLSPHAQGFGPIDNLIMTCINRAAHSTFGYFVENQRMTEGDRLIWAVDIDALCRSFGAEDWEELVGLAIGCGAAGVIRSGLEFASAALATPVPATVLARLAADRSAQPVTDYLGAMSKRERLRRDLAAMDTLSDRLAILATHALPPRSFLIERYPQASHWPLAALQMRRVVDSAARLLMGRR